MGEALFNFCVNSNAASPCRECPYFPFIPHLFPLFNHGLSQTYLKARELKAAEENPLDSNTLNHA